MNNKSDEFFLRKVKNQIADRLHSESDKITITCDGKSVENYIKDKKANSIPEKLQSKQLIEIFATELPYDNTTPKNDNIIDNFVNQMIARLTAYDKPIVAIAGNKGIGKTTVIKTLNNNIIDGVCPDFLKKKRIYKINPKVIIQSSKDKTESSPEHDSFISWLVNFSNKDYGDVILYTDNSTIATCLITYNVKTPYILEMGDDFTINDTIANELTHYDVHQMYAVNVDMIINIFRQMSSNNRLMKEHNWKIPYSILKIFAEYSLIRQSEEDYDVLRTYHSLMDFYGFWVSCAEKNGIKPKKQPKADDARAYLKKVFDVDREDLKKAYEPKLEIKKFGSIRDFLNFESENENDEFEDDESLFDVIEQNLAGKSNNATSSTNYFDVNQILASRKKLFKFKNKDEFRKKLSFNMIGQEKAINKVLMPLIRCKAGISDPAKPIASLLFCGPSGVGKTELAKSIASTVFGSEKNMLRIDCGELEKETCVSRLLGTSPGYIGYHQDGVLIKWLKEHKSGVILLDEIEKASHDFYDSVLLQLLDTGRITSGKGETLSASNTVIIATSNLGSQKIGDNGLDKHGFTSADYNSSDYSDLNNEIINAVKENFRVELINRFDEIIPFEPLSIEDLRKIFKIKWSAIYKRLNSNNISVKLDNSIATYFATISKKDKFGARNMLRNMNTMLLNPISDIIIDNNRTISKPIYVGVADEHLVFSYNKNLSKPINLDNLKTE